MKFSASVLTILASVMVLQSCGSDTSQGSTELAAVLDAAADREGVAPGDCRDACLAAALEVFDACTAESDDREACFGQAIHAFFECAKTCEPPSCEADALAARCMGLRRRRWHRRPVRDGSARVARGLQGRALRSGPDLTMRHAGGASLRRLYGEARLRGSVRGNRARC